MRRIKDQREVAVDLGRLRLIDDQQAVQRAVLRCADRRAVPERPGVGRREAVIEARARGDRLLGQRCPVHRVRHAHAVPVDRGLGRQLVDEADLEFLAALDAQHRPRNRAVIAGVARPDRAETVGLRPRRDAEQRQRGGEAGAGDDGAAGQRIEGAHPAGLPTAAAAPPHPHFHGARAQQHDISRAARGRPWLLFLASLGGRGGTGRRTGFRFQRRKACGFKSLRPHQPVGA